MDPVTAIGVIGSVLGVAGIVAQCLKGLTSLTTVYRSADLLLMLVIGHLHTVEAILSEIRTWLEGLPNALENVDLLGKVDRAVKCCAVIAEVLAEKISGLQHGVSGKLTLKSKLLYMLGENEIKEMNTHLATQVQALHILVDAGRCNTAKERNELLDNVETRSLLRQIEDDSSSYLHGPSAAPSILTSTSEISDNSNLLHNEYEFDSEVLNSKVYRNAFMKMLDQERKHLSNHIEQRRASQGSGNTIQPIACEASAQEDPSEPDNSQQQIITRLDVNPTYGPQVEAIGEISNNNDNENNMVGNTSDAPSRNDHSIVSFHTAIPVNIYRRNSSGASLRPLLLPQMANGQMTNSNRRGRVFTSLTGSFGKQWNEKYKDRVARKIDEIIDVDSKEVVRRLQRNDKKQSIRLDRPVLGIEIPTNPTPSLISKFWWEQKLTAYTELSGENRNRQPAYTELSGENRNRQSVHAEARCKVAIVGSGGCGKTNLIQYMLFGCFDNFCDPTIFDTYTHRVTDGQNVAELDILDSTGLSEYRLLRKNENINSQIVCICFSITSRSSLEEVQVEWIHEVSDYTPEITVILLGCKKDRVTEREVSTAEGWRVSWEIGAVTYIECSARTGEGVRKLSNRLAEEAIKKTHTNA